jgi:N-acyl homoserine lactone hydrolase
MKRSAVLATGIAAAVATFTAGAQTPAEVTLTRFDCGGGATPVDVARFSDTNAMDGKKVTLTASCYLIKHGDEYMIWDTGYAAGTPTAAKKSLVEQLAELEVKPEQIKYVGISHYHADHIGQANLFPGATLLIGKADWDVLSDPKPPQGVNPALVSNWVGGTSKAEPVAKDKDVFGDGSVFMFDTPGHTPGHHSLLVKLKTLGNVLLTGDMAHFHENYASNGVPTFNTNRADTLASYDRFKAIAKNLKATVIIQHDARDIAKLPAFPNAAK